MKYSFRLLTLLAIALGIAGCEKSGRTLPRHTGESGEILIVMPEKEWLGPMGDSLRQVLERNYPMLPQAEPSYSLLHFSPVEMSDLLWQHRNIMQVLVGPEAEGVTKITFQKDKYSNHQLLITLRAGDQEGFYELLRKDLAKVETLIDQTEIDRLQAQLKRFGNEELEQTMAQMFGMYFMVPADARLARKGEHFLWIKRERQKYLGNTPHDITTGYIMYAYPYTGDSAFTQQALLAVRDSLLKRYVPGPKKGSYMTTEMRFAPQSQPITYRGNYAVLTRGFWKMANYTMGGPFIQLATTSPDSSHVVVASGFAFAPRFDKREYVREIEASIRSLQAAPAP